MKFSAIPTVEAEGAILAHSIRLATGAFKKGRRLSAPDVATLLDADIGEIVAARLEAGDEAEDAAAERLAKATRGEGTSVTAPFTGRCNLYADAAGVAVIDSARLERINLLDEALTVATLPPFETVSARQMVATIKVIPFSAPSDAIDRAVDLAREKGPLVRVAPFRARSVGLVMSILPGTKPKLLDNTAASARARLDRIGSELAGQARVAHDPAAIAEAIRGQLAAGRDFLLVSGASAIVDRRDVVPEGIVAAGGTIDHFGLPVDPGNLLLLAHIDKNGKNVPVIGLPGCARSLKLNGFDWVLARLAAGLDISRKDIAAMGSGGLLKEISSRPQPRSGPIAGADDATAGVKRAPKIAVIVLAAGRSRRMGAANKLLAEIDGAPMVRRAVETARASRADPVIVVTGHEAERIGAALADFNVTLVHNPGFAEGLSGSVRRGLDAVPAECDGALVLLGDMPQVTPDHLDRLIAAYDPVEGRAICVPTSQGKRGNPVLWDRRFFAEITQVAGDVGARHLIGEHDALVCEVALDDDGVLLDIDTPAALSDYRAGRRPAYTKDR